MTDVRAKPKCGPGSTACGNSCVSGKYTCRDFVDKAIAAGLIASAPQDVANLDFTRADLGAVSSSLNASTMLKVGSKLTIAQQLAADYSDRVKLSLYVADKSIKAYFGNSAVTKINWEDIAKGKTLDESVSFKSYASIDDEEGTELTDRKGQVNKLILSPDKLTRSESAAVSEALVSKSLTKDFAIKKGKGVDADVETKATLDSAQQFVKSNELALDKATNGLMSYVVKATKTKVSVTAKAKDNLALSFDKDGKLSTLDSTKLDLSRVSAALSSSDIAKSLFKATDKDVFDETAQVVAAFAHELGDKVFDRKPTMSKDEANKTLQTEAVAWAESKFGPATGKGVNGFTAEQTAAHDIAHPATHRLTGMTSDQIHQDLGSLKSSDGKPSLLAEEAIVNVTEHLSRGDGIRNSIVNGLRLSKVLSRMESKENQAYVRSAEFEQRLTELSLSMLTHNDYSPIMYNVSKYTVKSGTVQQSGSDLSTT